MRLMHITYIMTKLLAIPVGFSMPPWPARYYQIHFMILFYLEKKKKKFINLSLSKVTDLMPRVHYL